MCIVIDTNTFNHVFDETSPKHAEFKAVLDWILNGKGKIVYGGSKYLGELKESNKYLKLFGQFNRIRKVVRVNDSEIDNYQKTLEKIENHKDFDDPHLVAICYISKCKLICTCDSRAMPFLNRKDFYPGNSPRPKLYTKAKNSNLLRDNMIADICTPCIKLNKANSQAMQKTTANVVSKAKK